MNKKRYEALTALRGIFIYGIALFHFGGVSGKPLKQILGPVYHLGGYYGDYFFFMLSGFLMCHVYRDRIAAGNTQVIDFLVAKLKKIWPLFLVTNIIALLFKYQLDSRDDICLKNIITSSLMVSTGWVENIYPYNYPAWFLCVLILCYLIFYFISKLYARNKDGYYLLVTVLIMLGYMIEIRQPDIPFLFEGNGEGFLNFFGGVLLYDLICCIKEKCKSSHLTIIRLISVLILIGAPILFSLYDINDICGDKRIVITVLILPPCLFLAVSEGIIQRILELRPFVFLGELSMYIFLIHVPVIYAFMLTVYYFKINLQPNIFLVSYLFIITGISVVLRFAGSWRHCLPRVEQDKS